MTSPYSKEHIHKAMERIKKQAEEMKRDAALGGHMHDGGARELLNKMELWWLGYQQKFPPFIAEQIEQIQNEEDPEYQEYLRLKKKFGEE